MKTHSDPSDDTNEADTTYSSACSPGVVAGAVLRSARRSACLSEAELAERAEATEAGVRSWEDGSSPLAWVPVSQIDRLESELLKAGADPQLVRDVAVGAWCDLVIVALADGEDTSCLLADPAAGGESFGELLVWAISGQPPARYRAYATPGRLVPDSDAVLADRLARILNTRQQAPEAPTDAAQS